MIAVGGGVVGEKGEAAGRVGWFPPLVKYVHETVVVYFELQYTFWKKKVHCFLADIGVVFFYFSREDVKTENLSIVPCMCEKVKAYLKIS